LIRTLARGDQTAIATNDAIKMRWVSMSFGRNPGNLILADLAKNFISA
jgi:hypothetical protein